MQLDLVSIVVEDHDLAIAFFVGGFGFEVVEDTPTLGSDGAAKRWVVVRPPGGGTGLVLAVATTDSQRRALGSQTGDRVGFFLRVDDFEAGWRRALGAGAHVVRPPVDQPYGRTGVVADIAGNRWDVIGPA